MPLHSPTRRLRLDRETLDYPNDDQPHLDSCASTPIDLANVGRVFPACALQNVLPARAVTNDGRQVWL